MQETDLSANEQLIQWGQEALADIFTETESDLKVALLRNDYPASWRLFNKILNLHDNLSSFSLQISFRKKL